MSAGICRDPLIYDAVTLRHFAAVERLDILRTERPRD